MSERAYCRPGAYELFAAQLSGAPSTDALVRGAVAISMHELDDADLGQVESNLDRLASIVRLRARSGTLESKLAHLHDVLFDEQGFIGNTRDYYNPLNSYLPAVIQTRMGLPITLSLIYKAVGERVGLSIEGINAPGHFMASVQTESGLLYVDAFDSGRALTREEAFIRIEAATGVPAERNDALLRPASNRQWLNRMMSNLQNIFAQTSRQRDLAAMAELQALLS